MIALWGLPALGAAQDDSDEQEYSWLGNLSADEIALELSNPVSSLAYLGNEIEFYSYQGDLPEAGDQSNTVYLLKPSLPIPLSNGKNILMRAKIPIYADLPVWKIPFGDPLWRQDFDYPDFRLRQSPEITGESGEFVSIHGHIGDIGLDFAYGGVSDSGFISMYGIALQLKSSTNVSAARDQRLLGPQIALGKKTSWGIYGAWLTHLVNISDGAEVYEDYDTSETYIDIFFAYGLGNGWQIFSSPRITYDWEADSGNDLLLPIAAGISKTTRIGRMPLKLSFELEYFVVSPDRFGSEWLATFSFTPVFPNPFGR